VEFVARGLTRILRGKVLYAGLDLAIRPGSKLVVRGASGSGKTQLLRHLAGLDAERPDLSSDSETLTLSGRSMAQWGDRAWRREVAYVPQQVPRLPGSPADFSARLAGLKAQRGTRGGDGESLALDLGLEAGRWRQHWSELSVGERQRAMLAILVAREPAVLLLDEPTAPLDPESTRRVEEALRDRTVLWVTHDRAQEQRLAGEVIELGRDPNGN